MRLLDIGTAGFVRQRQAEKARETDCVDVGGLGLEGPPKDFRPHIDAEGRLNRWPLLGPLWRTEKRDQLPLIGMLGGRLQDRVDHLVLRWRNRFGIGRHRRQPRLGYLGELRQDRFFPDQADREHVGQRCVGLAA